MHLGIVISTRLREHSGSVVGECLTQDRGVVGSSLTGVTALCSSARHINSCLVLRGDNLRHNIDLVNT